MAKMGGQFPSRAASDKISESSFRAAKPGSFNSRVWPRTAILRPKLYLITYLDVNCTLSSIYHGRNPLSLYEKLDPKCEA